MSALFVSATLNAQTVARVSNGDGFDFSIKNIMRGPELYGRAPANVRWSADAKWIYFLWNAPGSDWRETPKPFRIRASVGAKPEQTSIAQSDSASPYLADGSLSSDGKWRAVDASGDLYLISTRDGSMKRLTQTLASETHPTFSSDGKTLYFLRDGNAYALTLDGGLVRQLTDIRPFAPDTTKKNAANISRLEQQQKDLFEVIRDQARQDSITRADRKTREGLALQAIHLAAGERVASIEVSPNGKAAIVVAGVATTTTRSAEVPQFVTSSGYVENIRGRTKVGDALGRSRAMWISLVTGKATPLKLFGADSVSGFVVQGGWNEDGSRAVLFALPSHHKSRLLYTIGSDTSALTTVETLRDSAWVGGPCGSCAGFYDDGKRIWFVSESSGYAQLYSASANGSDIKPLTTGKWEVLAAQMSQDKKELYLTTSEPSSNEKQFYRMNLATGARTRITSQPGGHAAVVSPDGRMLADVYSFTNQPPDLFLQANSANAKSERLTTSASAEWLKGPWIAPEIVQIPASDGINVPGHIYRPQDMGAQPNGAAVIFVHGAGYLHNVGNFWSEYPREYMFNQYLAKHGYVVLDIDYRASSGYGRDWRTAIYRWMGGRDLQDHVDASKWLTQKYGVPGSRIGIYGGSYGGFMTLMAMFTAPDYFGAGAGLRSVTDWAHYNEGYTSAILNRPQDDTLAYHQSSPIYYAEGLRGPLLLAHGMVDVNVMYQDIVRLEQRLIELGKTNWSLASYPVEDHGFVRPSSWTDEYTRIFDLFESTIAKGPAWKSANNAGPR